MVVYDDDPNKPWKKKKETKAFPGTDSEIQRVYIDVSSLQIIISKTQNTIDDILENISQNKRESIDVEKILDSWERYIDESSKYCKSIKSYSDKYSNNEILKSVGFEDIVSKINAFYKNNRFPKDDGTQQVELEYLNRAIGNILDMTPRFPKRQS